MAPQLSTLVGLAVARVAGPLLSRHVFLIASIFDLTRAGTGFCQLFVFFPCAPTDIESWSCAPPTDRGY
jgi:hypothetical protein